MWLRLGRHHVTTTRARVVLWDRQGALQKQAAKKGRCSSSSNKGRHGSNRHSRGCEKQAVQQAGCGGALMA
jgi:hypothetical protein